MHQSTYLAFIDYINLCYNRSDTLLLGLTRVKNKQTNFNSRNIGIVFVVLAHRTYTLCLCPELAVIDPRFCGVPACTMCIHVCSILA